MLTQWNTVWALPDRRQIYDWALEKIGRPKSWTRAFDIAGSRHMIEPFDSLRDERIREVNVMAPVQDGKSVIADVTMCYWRANAPGPHLALFQDDDIAKEYAEARAMPLLTSIPEIIAQLPSERGKIRNQEIIFTDGERLVIWGPVFGNLQTFGYRYVTCDELWRWKPGTLKEAKGRLRAYEKMELDKLLCISQGGVELDDWDFQWQSGEQRLWCVRCEACNHLMYPRFTGYRQDGTRWGLRFDMEYVTEGDKESGYDHARAAATVRFECEACRHEHRNSRRVRANWNATGEYVTEGPPNAKAKSYRWNAIISTDWGKLAEEFAKAKSRQEAGSGSEDLVGFFQKKMAEPASLLHMSGDRLKLLRTDVKDEPIAGAVRVMTCDRQAKGVTYVTGRVLTKAPLKMVRVMFRKCTSDADLLKAVDDFRPTEITVKVNIGAAEKLKWKAKAVFLDSRFNTYGDQGVYMLCAANGWLALQGDKRRSYKHTDWKKNVRGEVSIETAWKPYSEWVFMDPLEGMRGAGKHRCPRMFFCSNIFREKMQNIIDRGAWIEPQATVDPEMEEEYERQMNSEYQKPRVDKFTGDRFMEWVSPSKNNHAADCGKMQALFAAMAGYL